MDFLLDKEYFDQIMQGSQASTVDFIVVLLIILGILALLISFFVIETQRNRKRRLLYAEKRFKEAAETKRVSAYEKDLVERMAKELPHGTFRKHELITNAATFDVAARKLKEKGEVPDEFIAALRLKLEFNAPPERRTIHSTSQLPEGTHLYFIDENDTRFHGSVYNVRPDALLIRPTNETNIIPVGTRVKAYFKSRTGIYTFKTKVVNEKNNILICLHSEEVQKEQQRDYYRKELDKEVKIKHKVEDEEPIDTRLVDLGGGGARVVNPPELLDAYKEKDEVFLLLNIDDNEQLKVPGSIVRVSDDRKYLHVRFNGIREGVRDKIIGYVLNA